MCILICNTLLSIVGVSYVTDYHHQISVPAWKARISELSWLQTQGKLEPSLESATLCFSRASHRPKKRDTRRRNRNCKYIKMYCQYLPHQGFMDLKAFFFMVYV